ncbi:MAG: hypothetical protein ROO71_06540 [Balneola sp.]
MAVPYIFITQKAPYKKEGIQETVTYARTVSTRKATTEEIADNISSRCTLNPADVIAVLYALGYELKTRINNGEMVELEGIGSFRIQGGTGAVEEPEKVRSKDFDRRKVNFTPDASLKASLRTLSFIRKHKD